MPIPSDLLPGPDADQWVVLHDVTWEQYEALRAANDTPALRFTYHEGTLEIMSPSRPHEQIKTLIARLLEAYGEERGLALDGFGSTTFRNKAKRLGLEPDECYVLGHEEKELPDLAIEVALQARGVNKLAVYQGLGVPEVWFWIDDGIRVFCLRASGYEPRARSALLPDLDLERVAEAVRSVRGPGEQTASVRAFRASLFSSGGAKLPPPQPRPSAASPLTAADGGEAPAAPSVAAAGRGEG